MFIFPADYNCCAGNQHTAYLSISCVKELSFSVLDIPAQFLPEILCKIQSNIPLRETIKIEPLFILCPFLPFHLQL